MPLRTEQRTGRRAAHRVQRKITTSAVIGPGPGTGGGSVTLNHVVPTNSVLEEGESVQVQAEVENTTTEDQTIGVIWRLDGTGFISAEETVGAGETAVLANTTTYDELRDLGFDPGRFTLSGVMLGGDDWTEQTDAWGTMTIEERPSSGGGGAGVGLTGCSLVGPSSVRADQSFQLEVAANVQNFTSGLNSATVNLLVDGTQVGSANVGLGPGELATATVTANLNAPQNNSALPSSGSFGVTVEAAGSTCSAGSVTVEAPPQNGGNGDGDGDDNGDGDGGDSESIFADIPTPVIALAAGGGFFLLLLAAVL